MLVQRGYDWRSGIASAIVDRMVGVGTLVAVCAVVLLVPSSLALLGNLRAAALMFFWTLLTAGMAGLFFVPKWAPILKRQRLISWAADLAYTAHHVLLGSPSRLAIIGLALTIHLMTVVVIWLLGRTCGIDLSVVDAAVLFGVMMTITMIPASIGGWGLREIAVTSLLSSYGVPLAQALLFSIFFGIIQIIAALPGAIVWAVYPPGYFGAK
jgi:hypothetical protein